MEEKKNNEEVRNDGVVNDSNQGIDFSTVSTKQDNKTKEYSPQPIHNYRPPIRFGDGEY